MRAERGRTKKLIVAFHFQHVNQAAWKCDTCRKRGLERKRRCGFSAGDPEAGEQVVWARKNIATTTCPRSYITPQSLQWLEEYWTWRLLGGYGLQRLSARQAQAFCILENELVKEQNDAHA